MCRVLDETCNSGLRISSVNFIVVAVYVCVCWREAKRKSIFAFLEAETLSMGRACEMNSEAVDQMNSS